MNLFLNTPLLLCLVVLPAEVALWKYKVSNQPDEEQQQHIA